MVSLMGAPDAPTSAADLVKFERNGVLIVPCDRLGDDVGQRVAVVNPAADKLRELGVSFAGTSGAVVQQRLGQEPREIANADSERTGERERGQVDIVRAGRQLPCIGAARDMPTGRHHDVATLRLDVDARQNVRPAPSARWTLKEVVK